MVNAYIKGCIMKLLRTIVTIFFEPIVIVGIIATTIAVYKVANYANIKDTIEYYLFAAPFEKNYESY